MLVFEQIALISKVFFLKNIIFKTSIFLNLNFYKQYEHVFLSKKTLETHTAILEAKKLESLGKDYFCRKKYRRICIIVTFTLSIFSGAWLRVKRFGQKTRLEPLLYFA